MLDEKDLQAIAQLLAQQKKEIIGEIRQEMDTRFSGFRQEMDTRFNGFRQEMGTQFSGFKQEIRQEMDAQFVQQKSDMMHEVRLLMESYFDPRFNLLADGLALLKERSVGHEEIEEISDRLDVLEAVAKVHSREIEKLKVQFT